VAIDPGSLFRAEPDAQGTLAFRLCFSSVAPSALAEGMTRLKAALDDVRAGRSEAA
jgi:DNA-binding transcriptional MocR family regulator